MEQRTLQQNKALHLYFTMVSDALNSAGYSVDAVLNNFTMEIVWTPELCKELLWKTAQKRMFGKLSTTELDKSKEIDAIYDVVNRFLGEKLKVESIPFPHIPNENEE